MTHISKQNYMGRYVGNIDPRRTSTFKSKGLDMKKYSVEPTNYPGLSKIVRKLPHRDITGYIMNGNVHASKTSLDRSRKSKKQSWEN